MARNHEPEVLMRYDLRRGHKALFERLEAARTYDGESSVFELSIAMNPICLLVPKKVVVYASIDLPKSEQQRIIFAHRDEENDLTPAYASLIVAPVRGFTHASTLFDFCWYSPQTSRRIYDEIRKSEIDFKRLEDELTAPTVKMLGQNHPLRHV